MPTKPSDRLVYHYCNTTAFMSIIQSNCLRLTSSRAANDSLDCVLLNKTVSHLLENNSTLDTTTKTKIHNTFITEDLGWIPFITCLSYGEDLLSQWRGYADDGKGIALGFSEREIIDFVSKINKHNPFRSSLFLNAEKINYGLRDSDLEKIVNEALRQIEPDLPSDAPDEEKSRVNNRNYEILSQLKLRATFLKPMGFHEENEFRIGLLSKLLTFEQDATIGMALSRIGFINRNNILVPYFDLGLPQPHKILIGPKNPSSKEQIFYFVHATGSFTRWKNICPEQIEKSSLSFR